MLPVTEMQVGAGAHPFTEWAPAICVSVQQHWPIRCGRFICGKYSCRRCSWLPSMTRMVEHMIALQDICACPFPDFLPTHQVTGVRVNLSASIGALLHILNVLFCGRSSDTGSVHSCTGTVWPCSACTCLPKRYAAAACVQHRSRLPKRHYLLHCICDDDHVLGYMVRSFLEITIGQTLLRHAKSYAAAIRVRSQ